MQQPKPTLTLYCKQGLVPITIQDHFSIYWLLHASLGDIAGFDSRPQQ